MATFARVRVEQLYPGINLVYYGNQRQLEYDFTLAPGADPDVIEIHFDGADKISIGGRGELILALGRDEIRQPSAGHLSDGGRRHARQSAAAIKFWTANTVAFAIGEYDHQLPLVIDPVLSFSTYFGGNPVTTPGRWPWTQTVLFISRGRPCPHRFGNQSGAFFHAGRVSDKLSKAAYRLGDAFVAKFDNPGTNLIYLTYLGGSGDDAAYGLAVDNAGDAYVAGATDRQISRTRNAHLQQHRRPF